MLNIRVCRLEATVDPASPKLYRQVATERTSPKEDLSLHSRKNKQHYSNNDDNILV